MFKRNKPALWALVLLLVLSLALAACGGSAGDDTTTEEPGDNETEDNGDAAPEGPQEGGEIVGAMHTAPSGVFNPVFYEETYEANILDFTHESLVGQNNSLEFIPELAHSWDISDDQTEITFHLEEGVKWHDGEDFTAEDVVFTYEVISHPDYIATGGTRNNYSMLLKGYEAFSSGEADSLEGVVAEDDYTVTFIFEEPNINPLYYTSFTIIPKHVFENVEVADMPEAPESREPGQVIGTGPFKFSDWVEREQYVLERHDDYWQGRPYLDKVTWRIVDQSLMTSLLQTGEIDFLGDPDGIAPADYDTVVEFGNIEIHEQPDFGYQLLGFMHNHLTDADAESGEINPDNWIVNEKIADPRVRQAIAHAINRQALVDGILHGRGEMIGAPIAQAFWAYDPDAPVEYEYSTDQAAALLDEAGYVDVDGDGFREDPDGNEWVLNMHYPLGNQLRERAAPIIQQDLEDAGIKVNLNQPTEMSTYIVDLGKAMPDWDLYMLGWSLGSGDPDPIGLWNIEANYNYGRWNNPESDELLFRAITAPDAFEQSFREEMYSKWTTLFSEDLPALLLFAQNKLYSYNERLQGIDPLPYQFVNNPHLWWWEPDEDE